MPGKKHKEQTNNVVMEKGKKSIEVIQGKKNEEAEKDKCPKKEETRSPIAARLYRLIF
jgi:hypothetical protein